MSKDPLGDRMKENYENRVRYYLPRRTYTILRLDGVAFHTYTKGLKKPFDLELISDLDSAVIDLMPKIQGSQFAYIQSDEVSILLTDFAKPTTDAWFDGNLQKMVSVSAGWLTALFTKRRMLYRTSTELAVFDSRAFTIPDRTEVMNEFIFRNQDCARNSVSMVAQSLYSHKELHGKSSAEQQEMLHAKGINWADYPAELKNGRLVVKTTFQQNSAERHCWEVVPAWKFTSNKEKLLAMIPQYT